ncbi:MAG: hypothetical protein IT364_25215 [Candidatus Hydrogenedentes bacterium]|nr:hypothetical protein [Candidatus Hydrogenedentota bacterium]
MSRAAHIGAALRDMPVMALFRRELLTRLRMARPFVLLIFLLLFAGFLVSVNYPERELPPYAFASSSQTIVSVLIVLLFASAIILLPPYGAATIQSERARDTFEQLSLTLIRPSGIILAKFLGTLGVFALLAIAVLPFLGTSFFLIGMDWQAVLASAVIILMTAISCASAGVYCSTVFHSATGGVIVAYLCALAMLGGYLIPILIFLSPFVSVLNTAPPPWLVGVAICGMMTSPLVALVIVTTQESLAWGVLATAVFQAFLSIYVLRAATRVLRRPFEPPPPEIEDISPLPAMAGTPIKTSVHFKPLEDRWNPVTQREFRWGPVYGRLRGVGVFGVFVSVLLWIVIALGFIFAADTSRGFSPDDALSAINAWIGIQMALVVLQAPGLASVLFVTERERNTYDLLRMTTVRPTEILRGKIGSALAQVGILLLAAVALSVFLSVPIYRAPGGFTLLATGFCSAGVVLLTCAVLGTVVSLRARTTPMAVLGAYGLSAAALLGPVALHWIAEMIVYRFALGGYYSNELLALSPLTMYFWAQKSLILGYNRDFLLMWAGCTALHLLMIAVLYRWTRWIFLRKAVRDG